MNCGFDLKEYVLGEASRDDAKRVEAHLRSCDVCREEAVRLRHTHASLMALRDEELPRRIAFVSDKVFEPRWYQRLWNSGPQLGFVAASLLACAILIHAFARPAPRPAPSPTTSAAADPKAIEDRVRREVSSRLESVVQSAVAKAVADSESRQAKRTVDLVQASDRRHELDRRATLEAVAEQTRVLQKQVNNMYVTAQNLRSGE